MRIGYACLIIGIEEANFTSCTLKSVNENNLLKIIENNLQSLENIVDYNIANNIKLFRITSDLIPFGSSDVNKIPWWCEFSERLGLIGQKILSSGMRISMHPGQYTVLNSPRKDVVERAIEDLNYHTKVLDSLGTDTDSKIIMHIGGAYNDKNQAINRFIKNFKLLPEKVKRRIAIENDDKLFNIEDVLKIGETLGLPVVFDNLHHQVLQGNSPGNCNFWINKCKGTWSKKDGIQKIHYSEQDLNKRPGAHAGTINLEKFTEFTNELNDELDIMLEVKDKNLSAIKCIYGTSQHKNIKNLEVEWSKYKYAVLESDPANYHKIRQLLKNKREYPVVEFYKLIDEALAKEEMKGNTINAALHVWGYFKNVATEQEKNKFMKYLRGYEESYNSKKRMKNMLWRLTKKYDVDFLLKSYYFYW